MHGSSSAGFVMTMPIANNIWLQRYTVTRTVGRVDVYSRKTGKYMGYGILKHPGKNKDRQGWLIFRGQEFICERRVIREALHAITEATPE